ncbi:hypothetical protein [Kitasatospora sp. NPDC056181]|uniref:hypothetical protein n=1 Tax=Kitasatospora sp. NPDC056181 TaxID=3345737 RepID=UPI0035D99482
MDLSAEVIIEFLLSLNRVASKARTGRSAGHGPQLGVVESYEDRGELSSVIQRFGEQGLPTLYRLDPYHDHTLQNASIAALVRDLEKIELNRLPQAEAAVLNVLLDWGIKAFKERELRIRISGEG